VTTDPAYQATGAARVTGVLLAAGGGTRLGLGPKALLRHRGNTLAEHLVAELRAGGCGDVVVVLGAQAERVRAEARLDERGPSHARVLVNGAWGSGMGGSFRAGIAALPAGTAALVALVDQPGTDRRLVARIIHAHRPGRVTAAGYAGQDGGLRRGHPVLFAPAHARSAALFARGDSAARTWLARNPGLIDLVDCSDLDDGGDVDTAEDLARLVSDGGGEA
jgi:nicotine blue oxidoreductase